MLSREDYEEKIPEEEIEAQEEPGGMKSDAREREPEEGADLQKAAAPELLPAQDEEYESFIVRYNWNINGPADYESDRTFQIINELYGVLYVPAREVPELSLGSYSYNSVPKCYTYMDLGALSASGVTRLHDHPYLKLRGAGTMVAVIDSGIDYRHEAFLRNGRTRILALWDQSLPGGPSELAPYGRVFEREEIDRALASENPLEPVPSADSSGHGTRLAAAAAGSSIPTAGFCGAAPEADLVVVKLKPAKEYLRQFYLFPPEAEIFQEDDIMLGLAFAVKCAQKYRRPLSACIGLGSSQGSHRGESPLSEYISQVTNFTQNAVTLPAGNEGAARHHFMDRLDEEKTESTVELKIGEKESAQGFSMEFWGNAPNFYEVQIQAPTGERLSISTALRNATQELSFVFVETKVLVNYVPIEQKSGNTLIFFRFLHPAAGLWKLIVRGRILSPSRFNIWLPVQGLISDETYFLESSPDYTITAPGDAADGMTATAYQYRDESLYVKASRGYSVEDIVKPDFAAPGVGVLTARAGSTANAGGSFGTEASGSESASLASAGFTSASGTSLAAAQTAGIAALLFEWAVIRGNEPYFTGGSVKNYLCRGALRDGNLRWPNPEWGYGRLDLYHTFELLT